MKILKNYIESNWISTVAILCLIPFAIWLIHSQDSRHLALALIVIGLFFTGLYRVFRAIKKIHKYEEHIDQTEAVEPNHKSKINYYSLGIELKKDSMCLDIFKNRKLEHSIKYDTLMNSEIVFLATSWYNWNWRHRGRDYYFEIILESENNSKELLRFKESDYMRGFEKTDFEDYVDLSNEIASLLKVKIKDCSQKSL